MIIALKKQFTRFYYKSYFYENNKNIPLSENLKERARDIFKILLNLMKKKLKLPF